MVQTVKFSQFAQGGTLDTNGRPVGLENGENTIWDFDGSGGSGTGITATISNPGNTLVKGDWVTINTSGDYIQAQADSAEHGECVGVVIEIISAGNTFVVQQAGYVTSVKAVFSGLQPGNPYFLDPATAGAMVNVDVSTTGFVSRPVFYPDTPTSGWVLPYRGDLITGIPLPGNGSSNTIPDIVTVNQNAHGLSVGQWVRVDAPVAGQAHYVRALADTLANAQAVGVVIQVVNANQFVLQFSGYNIGAVSQDYLGNVLVPPNVYYLSPTNLGAITSTPPTPGQISKPLYISERVTLNGGQNAGYILPQRPLAASVGYPGASPLIFCGILNKDNNFSDQNVLKDANGNTYNSYQIIIHSGDEVINYGIKFTGAPLIGIGFQLFIDGMWQTIVNTYADYINGVNSSAGVDTATWWGHVANAAAAIGRDMGLVLPPVSNHMGFISGNGILTCAPSGHVMNGNFVGVDLSVLPPIGYASSGWWGCDAGAGQATGMRVVATAPAVLTADSSTYIIVYGIPNS